MLLEKAVNYLQGNVRLRVVSGFPERVLNLCGARKLAFWDVCWVSDTEFVCSMSRRDYRALRRAAEGLDCRLTAERVSGLPFLLRHLRRRYILLTGLAAGLAGLLFGSFFVWDFQIEGNETVSDEAILRALEENGVGLGTFGFAIDGENLRNHVLLDLPELYWIAVNVSGCQAHVQVRERVEVPMAADRRAPANLVARRDGLVLKISALGGVKTVLPGATVTQGQLLISGVEDTGTYGARLKAGMGPVTARTWYTLTARLPLTQAQKAYTGEEETGLAVIFGTHRVKIYGNSSGFDGECDKITTRDQLRLLGVPLPVTVERETRRRFTAQAAALPAETVRRQGEALLKDYLHTLVDGYGTVTSTLCTARASGDALTVTLTAECVEEIGVSVPIYTDDTESPGR